MTDAFRFVNPGRPVSQSVNQPTNQSINQFPAFFLPVSLPPIISYRGTPARLPAYLPTYLTYLPYLTLPDDTACLVPGQFGSESALYLCDISQPCRRGSAMPYSDTLQQSHAMQCHCGTGRYDVVLSCCTPCIW